MGWSLLVIFYVCMLLEYSSIFHAELNKYEAFTSLEDVTGSSLILKYKFSAQCFWMRMRILGKVVWAVNVRNFSLDASILGTPHLKQHLPPLSCLSSQHFVLVLKNNKFELYNKSLPLSAGDSKCHSTHTLLLLQLSHGLVLEIMMWIPLCQPFLSWLRLCQS